MFGMLWLFLAKFCENTAGALWMQESNLQVVCTAAGSFVYKTDAMFLALCQCVSHSIFNLECNMMYTAAAIVKELLYGAVGACWFEKLNLDLAYLQEGCLYFLILYYFFLVELQTQDVCIVRKRICNALNGNAEMFNA